MLRCFFGFHKFAKIDEYSKNVWIIQCVYCGKLYATYNGKEKLPLTKEMHDYLSLRDVKCRQRLRTSFPPNKAIADGVAEAEAEIKDSGIDLLNTGLSINVVTGRCVQMEKKGEIE